MGDVGHVIALPRRDRGRVLDRAGRPSRQPRAARGRRDGDLPRRGRQHHGVGPGHEGHAGLGRVLPDRRRAAARCRSRSTKTRTRAPNAAGSCAATSPVTRGRSTRCWTSLPTMVSAPVSAESWQWVARLLDAAVEAAARTPPAGGDAGQAGGADVRGGAARAHRDAAAGRPQLGRRAAGPPGGRGASPHPRAAGARRGRWSSWRARSTMSRSAFAERFTAYVQVPPMQYLARWRLQLAARLLEERPHGQPGGDGGRLPVGGGVPPSVQAAGRRTAGCLAPRSAPQRVTRTQGTRKPEQTIRMCTIRSSLTL